MTDKEPETVIVVTYTANIYLGFLELDTGVVHVIQEARKICQEYVDEIGLCVTIEPVEYVYTEGKERGCRIGLINYPRFPTCEESLRERAFELAELLMVHFRQRRVSIVCTDRTIMLINPEFDLDKDTLNGMKES